MNEAEAADRVKSGWHGGWVLRSVALAFGTLTVIRVPAAGHMSSADLRRSTAFYPLVGLGVGLLPAAVLLLPLPVLPGAALALAVWVVITGALHLDGWADCCDAAFAPPTADAGETRVRRLAILKDPHIGVFGMVGTGLLLLGKWTALTAVPAFAPLVAAPVARWAMVLALRVHPPAREVGLAASLAGRVPLLAASAALAIVLLLLAVGAHAPLRIAGAAAVGMLAGVSIARFLVGRFGGLTGDVCGAVGEGTETVVLWGILLLGLW